MSFAPLAFKSFITPGWPSERCFRRSAGPVRTAPAPSRDGFYRPTLTPRKLRALSGTLGRQGTGRLFPSQLIAKSTAARARLLNPISPPSQTSDITLKICFWLVIIIMQDDATPTDTAPLRRSERRPRRGHWPREAERRVRPREKQLNPSWLVFDTCDNADGSAEPEIQENDAGDSKDDSSRSSERGERDETHARANGQGPGVKYGRPSGAKRH